MLSVDCVSGTCVDATPTTRVKDIELTLFTISFKPVLSVCWRVLMQGSPIDIIIYD